MLRLLSLCAAAIATVAVIAFVAVLPGGPIEPASAYFQESNIYRSGLVGTHKLALTFDDGPSAYTPQMLDELAKYNVKATFFVLGSRANLHPELLERMSREGHVIANHSLSHPKMGRRYALHPEYLIEQIGGTHDVIAPHLRPDQGLYFRAPYGIWRKVHAETLNADPVLRNYVGPIYWEIGGSIEYDGAGNVRAAADWDCWSHDWSTEQCQEGYLHEIGAKNGGIVLMHDIRERSVWLLQSMLPTLIQQGYEFVTLDQVPGLDPYRTPPATQVPVASLRGSQTAMAAPQR
jgi:peptidoglycan/xylan/chitin deacetylase (PgdA/CDA1 family)